MADDSQNVTLRQIQWREVFPFTNLFRTFRIAVHPSKLVLGLILLLLVYCGGRAPDGIWPHRSQARNGELGILTDTTLLNRMETMLGDNPSAIPSEKPQGVFLTFF